MKALFSDCCFTVLRDRAPPSERAHDSERQSFAVWTWSRLGGTALRSPNVLHWTNQRCFDEASLLLKSGLNWFGNDKATPQAMNSDGPSSCCRATVSPPDQAVSFD